MRQTVRFRTILLLVIAASLSLVSEGTAQTPRPRADEEPFVADYYYKAKWGYADEFIALFKKNHVPVLKKVWSQVASPGVASAPAPS